MKIKNLFENYEETFAENAMGTFKKYVRSPLVCPCSFLSTTHLPPPPQLHPPTSKVRSFWLELILSPSISLLVKFWKKKLIMSISIFGWSQRGS